MTELGLFNVYYNDRLVKSAVESVDGRDLVTVRINEDHVAPFELIKEFTGGFTCKIKHVNGEWRVEAVRPVHD